MQAGFRALGGGLYLVVMSSPLLRIATLLLGITTAIAAHAQSSIVRLQSGNGTGAQDSQIYYQQGTVNGAIACVDINECATDNGGCDLRTTCTNFDGGRTCGACPAGFKGDGVTGCRRG